ncbi:stage V sporulation protein B [Longirhabdus pacifica]|uniref:stage V sporulation protein B n=1 Tax=Longirhabdus pacifica TaxID=2305227 RepID=UPI001008B557|nr:stage V sporulation protein B [Longirhabdus pacifica]
MTKQNFIHGAMILLAAGIVTRILGFVPRIMLPRIIGAEGVGLYQMGYPFLIVLLTLITGGIPLAIAKLVAEAGSNQDERKIKLILKVSLLFTMTLGLLFTVLSMLLASYISNYLLTDNRVYYTFLSMSPIIFIVSISAVLRGYFQGRQNMIPSAASNITETIVRSIAMLALAYFLLDYGVEIAAAGAMLGVLIGEVFGLLVLYMQYRKHSIKTDKMDTADSQSVEKEHKQERGYMLSSFRSLFKIAMPVTGSRLVGSSSYFLESIMIVQSLAVAGIATTTATALYGKLTGMVIPLLLIPTAVTFSLAVSLVPNLSEAAVKNNIKSIQLRIHQSLRIALVIGVPFTVIIFVLAEPICQLLYGDRSVGQMLKWMAPFGLFIYLQSPLQAALQSLDRPGQALLNTFIGACTKLILIFILAAKLELGIMGGALAICINIVTVTLLHFRSVRHIVPISIQHMNIGKILVSGLVMAMPLYVIWNSDWTATLWYKLVVAMFIGIIVYFMMILMLNIINKHDMERVPWFGHRIKKIWK